MPLFRGIADMCIGTILYEVSLKENKVEECTNIFYIIELTSIKTYNLEQ